MADMNELKNMIRKGTVQSVNDGTMKARVKFGDKAALCQGASHISQTQNSSSGGKGQSRE